MLDVFDHENCRAFLLAKLQTLPRKGRGQLRRMAVELRVSTSYMSQVMKGRKPLTVERAALIAQFLNLGDFETRAFVCLAQVETAGNPVLKKHYSNQLKEMKEGRSQLAQARPFRQLSAEEEARLYSYWYYSAAYLCTSIRDLQGVKRISERIGVPRETVEQVLTFLTKVGLCSEKHGTYSMNESYSIISTESPMLDRLLKNWRELGLARVPHSTPGSDLFTSLPMAIDKATALRIRQILLDAILEIRAEAEAGKPRSLYCLNVDWFEI